MNCAASKALLTLHVLGDLDANTDAALVAHLETCADCRASLQEIDSTLGLLRDALAAPTHAVRQLTPAQKQHIHEQGKTSGGVVVSGIQWLSQHHRTLAAAAAAVFVVGMISLLMPATQKAREHAVDAQVMMQEAVTALEEIDEVSDRLALQPADELVAVEKGAKPGAPRPAALQKSMKWMGKAISPSEPRTGAPVGRGLASKSGLVGMSAQSATTAARSESSPYLADDSAAAPDLLKRQAPAPAEFESVAMVESPVVMGGILGNRSPRRRAAALKMYGGKDSDSSKVGMDKKKADSPADVEFGSESKESQPASELHSKREDAASEELVRARYTAYGVNPFVTTRQEPFSTFGIDVDTASYTLARNMMVRGVLPPAEAVRTEEFVNAFEYGVVAPTHRTFRITTELAPSPFGRGLHLLKIGVKGRRLGREEQRQAVLTFLVDTSGSMNAPERIGLVRRSLRLLVENLDPQDLVAVIQYDSHARLLLEHTPASETDRILQAVDRMQCSGSTNLEEGMNEAYRLASRAFVSGAENRVLLLSDGVANLGSMAAEDILAKVAAFRKQGIFCSVFGVGSGSYDDTMLETLANKGDGVYTFLDSEEQARRVFVDDLAATLNTIASDVKIQVEFNPNVVKQYRQLGYENRRLRTEDFRNDAVDAGEVGSGQSVTALYEVELLPQLLAKTRIDLPPRPLATVRVRYRRIDTGRVEEIERAVWPQESVATFEAADVRFRLAAAVAEFAELLRGSPFARGSSYADIADVLHPVALELHLDHQVQELLRLVTAAESMPRGE